MQYLTAPEVGKVLGLSADTVRRLVDIGELPSIRVTEDGGWRRVEKQVITDYARAKGLKLDWNALQK